MGRDFPRLYRNSRAEARRHGEMDDWEKSHKINIECRKAIEAAVSKGFDGERLKAGCAQEIIAQYGFKRVNYVLANTLQKLRRNEWISDEGMEWGERVFIPLDAARNREFAVRCPPGVLEDFVAQARQAYQALGLFGREQDRKSVV